MSDIFDVLGDEFDAQEFDPMTDFTLLPPGKYPVEIEEADVLPTKSGNGHYLKLKLRVCDGEFRGAPLYDNLNIDNPNQTTVLIAKRVLTSICEALGRKRIKDSAELVGGKLTAHVKVKDEQNRIRTYSKHEPVAETPKTESSGEKPPWMR